MAKTYQDPKTIPEKQVKERIKKHLKTYNAWWHMPVQQGYGASGLDFHVCHKGYFLGIEAKRPGKSSTPRQRLVMEQIASAGGKVLVIGAQYFIDTNTFSGEEELLRWLAHNLRS